MIARRVVALLLLVACARHEPAPVRTAAPRPRVVAPSPQLPKPAGAAPAKAPDVAPVARDFPEIASGGTLSVLFTFNSTGYFLCRGETLGYEYELLTMFAHERDDPHSWVDVSYWLIRKSKRSVYNDPVVKHGFARGTEPVAYVDQILQRWSNYKEFVKEPEPPAPTPAVPQPPY